MTPDEIKTGIVEGKITIAILGQGYIGLPLSCYLASKGARVIGVDIDPNVVEKINAGSPHIYEPDLKETLQTVLQKGTYHATADVSEAVKQSEVIMITVGTPVEKTSINFSYVERACRT